MFVGVLHVNKLLTEIVIMEYFNLKYFIGEIQKGSNTIVLRVRKLLMNIAVITLMVIIYIKVIQTGLNMNVISVKINPTRNVVSIVMVIMLTWCMINIYTILKIR